MNPDFQTLSISTPVLGLRPYVLVEYVGDGDVKLDAGGVDATSAEELAALAEITRQGAQQLRKLARAAKKAAKEAAK